MKKYCKINKYIKNEEGFIKIKYGKKKIWCPIIWYKDEKQIDVLHPEIGCIILMLQYTEHCPFKIWKLVKDYGTFSSLIPVNNVSTSFNNLTEEHKYVYENGILKDLGCYCIGNTIYHSIKLL